MKTSVAPGYWNGEICAEIREQFGISIDRSTEPAGIWIRAEMLRTSEDLLTAIEIGNALKSRLLSDRTKIEGTMRNDS
jgi:hypothetical protein